MAPRAKPCTSAKRTPSGNGAIAALHLKPTKKISRTHIQESNVALSTTENAETLASETVLPQAKSVSIRISSNDTCTSCTQSSSEGVLVTSGKSDISNILVQRVERLLYDCLSNTTASGDDGVDLRILEIALLDARQLDGVDAELLARAENALEQNCENEPRVDAFEEPEVLLERLFDAINDGDIYVVENCLDANADTPLQLPVDVVDYEGNTPLSVAACYGEVSIVELLLGRRAHPDSRNDRGRTPLWRACYNGHLDVIEVLLNGGADKTIPNHLQEEPGKYGTAESRAFVANWDTALTVEIRNRIGLKALGENYRSQHLMRRVSDFTNFKPNALSSAGTGHLVDMLLWDRDKEHKREELARRFQDHSHPGTSCPDYPILIGLKELNAALMTSHAFGKTPLVVCNGLDQPDRFLIYSCECVVDAKQLLSELHFRKSKTLNEIREDLKHKLLASMETHGIGLSLHIRMGDSACQFKDTFCAPGMFPAEVFGGSATWNSDVAREHFPAEDFTLQPDFRIVVSTSFSLTNAKLHLEAALPFFESMAIIEVDPGLES